MKKSIAAVMTLALAASAVSAFVVSAEEEKTITVAASPTPHAEILEAAVPLL